MGRGDGAAIEVPAGRAGVTGTARDRRVVAGRAVLALSTALSLAAAVLDVHVGAYRPLAYVLAGQAVAVLGALLTTRRPEHRLAWLVAAAGLWWAASNLTYGYAAEALVGSPGSLPAGTAVAWADTWAWLPGLVLVLAPPLLLAPDGRLPSRRWRPVALALVVGVVLGSAAASLAPVLELDGVHVANPAASDGAIAAALGLAATVLVVGGLAGGAAALVVRFRRAEGVAREQLRWVALSCCTAAALAVLGAALWEAVPGAALLPAASMLMLVAGVAVAVLRYRLYDIDLVVNRAAVYAALTLALGAAYALAVGAAGSFLSRREDLVVALVATGLVAVGFGTLRARVQRVVDRCMYGDRDDPYRALAGVSRSLADALHADEALPAAVATICRTLALQHVAVTVADDEGAAVELAAHGTTGAEALAVPLVHHGREVGRLRLSARPGERLRERDRLLLADLAPQVAAAVQARVLSRQLDAARRRQQELREEERRRIRRDLHDGLGPALAGLTFTVDAARNVVAIDRERADGLLADASAHAQAIMGDVRRLIYGLRPPTLDELGLLGALRGLAARDATTRPTVRVDLPVALPPLAPAVEVAAYRIAQEAVANAVRHADAARCELRLTLGPDAVLLRVGDDGRGLDGAPPGVGLQAMRERAEELGGTLEVVSAPGQGTTVTASLPRRPEATAP